jgi:crotonobetainyl-CoA:carnitine CoA-transferase CaiB-like acyl-CoA transferase
VPGEDTAAVLADFGMSAQEIASLTERGVVAG